MEMTNQTIINISILAILIINIIVLVINIAKAKAIEQLLINQTIDTLPITTESVDLPGAGPDD
jgi:hypothetical protein